MWETFWPDVLVALIGAALTVLIAVVTYWMGLRQREVHALRALIEEMHHRRALKPPSVLVAVKGARKLPDFHQANASVLSLRAEIRRTRDLARQKDDVQRVLSSMTRACNRYLELSAIQPKKYYFLLSALQAELSVGVHTLGASRGLVVKEPGGGAF